MTFRTLIRRSLRYHWRSHLGVVLGAAIGSAALIGALVVGDSVKESLRESALQRVGWISAAMDLRDRTIPDTFFNGTFNRPYTNAAGVVVNVQQNAAFAVLQSVGTVARQDGTARANHVNVLGMTLPDSLDIFRMTRRRSLPRTVVVNTALAYQLHLKVGDEVVVRLHKPSSLSREVAVAPREGATVSLRLKVGEVINADHMGDFSLLAGQSPPLNAFVHVEELNQALGLTNKVNLLLGGPFQYQHTPKVSAWLSKLGPPGRGLLQVLQRFGIGRSGPVSIPEPETAAKLNSLIPAEMVFEAAGLSLTTRSNRNSVELRTTRIFLDPPVARAVLAAETNTQPVLTFLVNLLRAGTNTTPYSMVTAIGAPWTPADLRADEIMVNQWLADDLQVKAGDEVTMVYFDPESGARLAERTNTFRVRGVVPLEMPWADRTLMPDFPGIEKAESTSDWDGGFPLVHKIRQKDEDYWKKYKGTPKAFVTLAAGQKMWANRFGDLTAIRFPIPGSESRLQAATNSTPQTADRLKAGLQTVEVYRATLEKKILAALKPEELGLRFEPVRDQAVAAAKGSQDFGGLFLGFSIFLIIAALLLMAMLFQFGLEQRMPEIGTLLAVGFVPKQVRKLLLREGGALSLLGGIIGALGGIAYAKAMVNGLTTIWRDAVGGSALNFHVTGQTLTIGLLASVIVNVVTLWLTLRKLVRRPARELLSGEVQSPESKVQSRGRLVGFAALAGAVALVGWALARGDTGNAGVFFGAGSMVLIAGLSFASARLIRLGGAPVSDPARFQSGIRETPNIQRGAGPEAGAPITLSSLAVRGCARRRKRSLGTAAMLACGSFLIVSIGVFRLDANRDSWKRDSGTGGFALIGETTVPVVHDLNTQSGRDFFALSESDFKGVSFVPFRVRAGDEASCLNLNAAQRPKLLGVKPEMLADRFAFAKGTNWKTLINTGLKPGANEIEVPAIGDANSIQWAMHKTVGDTIDYVDERGRPFKVRIVGAVANSILQGSLIIDESEFIKRFPGESGYRIFLIDAPSNSVSQLSATLSRAMQDVGLEITPAAQRLADFNAVQNTYLNTFQVLGGLGLLLGSVGLGIVVLRNVLERRGELAVLIAVGFQKSSVQRLLLMENGALLLFGLAVGVVAAAIAVLPAVLSPSAQLPFTSLALTLAAVLLNGAFWTWLATRFALRGDLLAALRNE